MPTNLPPEALEAEKRYRTAKTTAEKTACLEEFIGLIPKHKGTDKLRAGLRKRLSKLRTRPQTHKSVGRWESAFHINREGAGQVAVVGPTNVGKSALVAALTNATPDVGSYPHTTWAPIPGMMPVGDVQIQLIDTPPLDKDSVEPQLMDLIRRSDLILLVVDLQAYPIQQLEDTVALLQEHRIFPLHQRDRPTEGSHPTLKPLLVVVNKNDDESSDGDFEVLRELLGDEWPLLPVSAATSRNFHQLKQAVFERLEIMRIYTKPPGKDPDLGAPFVLKKGSTVGEFAGKIHQDFVQKLRSARVWGSGVYDGQMVGQDHILHDGDVVELRLHKAER